MVALILALFVLPQICLGADYDITKGTPFEFDPSAGETTALSKIDDIHYLCAYSSVSMDGWAVILAVNTVTDTLTKGTAYEFDTLQGQEPALCKIDATHYLCAYYGYGSPADLGGWAVVLTVDLSDSTITKETAFEFDADNAHYPALSKIDDTHYLCAYGGVDDDGWAVVLTVNTSNWTITSGTAFEFDASTGKEPSLSKIDDTHFLCAYYGAGIWSVVLAVNTSDWTITKGANFLVDAGGYYNPPLSKIDDTHFLCVYSSGWSVVLIVDMSDSTITKGTAYQFDTTYGFWPDLSQIDNTHYLCAHRYQGGDGKSVVLTVDTSTWTITKETPYIFDTDFTMEPSLSKIDDSHYLCAYEGSGSDGWSVILIVELPAAGYDISGNIGYFSDDAPVPNADVDLTEVDYTATTDEFGEYLFEDIPGGNYVSTPSKAEDLGGLSGLDASRIARFSAGLYTLNCIEMIAGDVSMNGEIGGLDASRVARYAVGTITELNPAGIEWVFTPEPIPDCADWPPIVYENTREYSPLDSDLTDEDFIGIRLGDVSGNWSPEVREPLTYELFESTNIEIDINSTLRIPVVIEEATAIEGIDISIAFDKEVLSLTGLTLNNGILAENDYAVESNLKDGKIVIYAQKELVSGAGVFAFMDFDVIGEVGTSSEIYLTRFDVNETEASGGFNVLDSENETVTRRLQVNVGQTLLEKIVLYSNNPNPFSTRTLIQYDLPKDTHVNIQIYNVKGQLVEELVNGVESAGRKQIEWETKDSSSGIYFYRLSTEDKTIIKKMLLLR